MTEGDANGAEADMGLSASFGGNVVNSAKAEAEAGRKRLEKMWAAGDIRGLAKVLFTNDAAVMLPEVNVTYGSAGATKVLLRLVQERGYASVQLSEAEVCVASNGHLLTERGNYRFKDEDRQILETGNYVLLWKREGRELKIHYLIWNTNAA